MAKNIDKYNNIFFIGICGISMSGLARLLKKQGKNVCGSDINGGEIKKKLKREGIKVFSRHNKRNIRGSDLVVFSGAIDENNVELNCAKERGIDVVERSELLFLMSKKYKNVIAISGTHGKTTTTAMISYIFLLCGFNPTIHIGGEFDFIGGNIYDGGKNYFITEACEFRDSFLRLRPTVSVVSNVEKEHLDYFKNFDKEKESFVEFANKTKKICFVNRKCLRIFKKCLNVETFGYASDNGYFLKNIRQGEDLKYIFDCYKNEDIFIGTFKLNIFGRHNLENALSAIAVCCEYNIDYKFIYLGLKTFSNVHRRFEYVGNFKNCTVIHDYAHHPTEIYNTIKTAKEVFRKKIVCVFQPHTYSRTKLLIDKFEECFDGLDCLYVVKTYPAREKYDYDGSAEFLKEKLLSGKPNFAVKGVYGKKEIVKSLIKEDLCGSVILFLGAGDIEEICKNFLKKSK